MATPVNVITGALGSGKTTTILALLRHKPADQRWAVLVNEAAPRIAPFGPVSTMANVSSSSWMPASLPSAARVRRGVSRISGAPASTAL